MGCFCLRPGALADQLLTRLFQQTDTAKHGQKRKQERRQRRNGSARWSSRRSAGSPPDRDCGLFEPYILIRSAEGIGRRRRGSERTKGDRMQHNSEYQTLDDGKRDQRGSEGIEAKAAEKQQKNRQSENRQKRRLKKNGF